MKKHLHEFSFFAKGLMMPKDDVGVAVARGTDRISEDTAGS